MQLAPEIEAAGYRLTWRESTPSTNDDAAAAARAGDPGRHWFLAGEQTAGRGRHGRHWSSPTGNLYASLLLVEPCEPTMAPQLGFVAGLALHEAVSATTGVHAPRLSLKWPNDLLLDGAKAAGLLLEGHRIGASGVFTVVIGLGVNIVAAPEGTPYPTAALNRLAPDLTPADLFVHLSAAFARYFEVWETQRGGFSTIRQLWLTRAAGLGGPAAVRLPGGERQGVFEGLDPAGRLQLRTPSGVELIDAGDLYFPNLRA